MSSPCQTMYADRPVSLSRVWLLLLLGLIMQPVSVAQNVTVWDGIYTDEQAQRGAEQYSARCASCHAADLRGNSNSPSLLGMSFMFLWEGRSIGELFEKMRSDMPTDQPGSLSAQAYADLVAFILASNQFPAGTGELMPDRPRLDRIDITSR